MKNLKTWLPVFNGFYGTQFEFDYERLEITDNESDPEIDYVSYQNDVAEYACEWIENECDFITKCTFEKVVSPKFYNYLNDSIDCSIDINLPALAQYIADNKDAFKQYLKDNFTSYDGFYSYYSNQFIDWKNDTADFTKFNDEFRLGSILDFYFKNEIEDAIFDMHNFTYEHVYEFDYITNE